MKNFFKSPVGRKLVMSVSGLVMLVFVIVHLLGNTSIFSGPGGINTYAMALHRLGPLLWAFRLVMIVMFGLHVFYGIQLTLENRAAKPEEYAVDKNIESTFAGRNIIWTGLIIAVFVAYHLFQFTFQVIDPQLSAGRNSDMLGRPDVYLMVVSAFRSIPVSIGYVFAMAILGLHLMHGIQGAPQTLGLNNEKTLPVIVKTGLIAALLIFIGYTAIPASVVAGYLR